MRRSAGTIGSSMIIMSYGSPSKKGRIIWGALVPYGEVWRTGANEATHIRFEHDMLIEGQPLAAGDYAIYSVPERKEWTIIFNKMWNEWGTEYDASQDILRVQARSKRVVDPYEDLSIEIIEDGMLIAWDRLEVKVGMTDQMPETNELL